MKKILIVDDKHGIRVLLKEILEREGYIVFRAANGHQAISIVKNESPHLVILDLKLSGTCGVSLLKQLMTLNPKMLVIMMTAYEELNLLNEAKKVGAVAHFLKPFNIKEFRKMIKENLKHLTI